MQAKMLKISIIVPIYNEELYISEFLQSLFDQDVFDNPIYNVDIKLVDGCSTDKTLHIIKSFNDNHLRFGIDVLMNSMKIVPKAMNIGIKASSADIVVRLDVHALYPKNYVTKVVDFLVANEEAKVVNVGATLITIPGDASARAASITLVTSSTFGVGSSFRSINDFEEPMYVDTVPFGCWWRKDLIGIGMFDEDMVRNQDDELNWRLRKRGGKIALIPIDGVKYFSRTSLKTHALMFYQYGLFKLLTYIKSRSVGSFRPFAPLALVLVTCYVFLSAFFLPYMLAVIYFSTLVVTYIGLGFLIHHKSQLKMNFYKAFLTALVLGITHFGYGFGFFIGACQYFMPWFRGGE